MKLKRVLIKFAKINKKKYLENGNDCVNFYFIEVKILVD